MGKAFRFRSLAALSDVTARIGVQLADIDEPSWRATLPGKHGEACSLLPDFGNTVDSVAIFGAGLARPDLTNTLEDLDRDALLSEAC